MFAPILSGRFFFARGIPDSLSQFGIEPILQRPLTLAQEERPLRALFLFFP
jgi:hypothetical protein